MPIFGGLLAAWVGDIFAVLCVYVRSVAQVSFVIKQMNIDQGLWLYRTVDNEEL